MPLSSATSASVTAKLRTWTLSGFATAGGARRVSWTSVEAQATSTAPSSAADAALPIE
jgi:hypothetical protein